MIASNKISRWLCAAAAALFLLSPVAAKEYLSGIKWEEPKVVEPGSKPGDPPSDAIILFDGTDLSAWQNSENWDIQDGVAVPRKGSITTKQPFGDIQLHVEWASPEKVEGSGQGRGNSGVYLMGKYEVQVLDSYNNETYFDGQAGSLYKQWPPLVNVSRPPGEWQTYDIIFTAPRFDKQKNLVSPAFVTVLHNGVLVQNHSELQGGTSWDAPPSYAAHPEKLPLQLQFHNNPVRFRNIWVRELSDRKPVYPAITKAEKREETAAKEKADADKAEKDKDAKEKAEKDKAEKKPKGDAEKKAADGKKKPNPKAPATESKDKAPKDEDTKSDKPPGDPSDNPSDKKTADDQK